MSSESPRFSQLIRSSFFRLAIIYALVFGISVSLLLGFIYWATAVYMSDQADALIEAEIQGLAEQYRSRGLKALTAVMRERLRRNPDSGMLYLFADRDYRALEGNLNRWPRVQPDEAGWVVFRLEHKRDPEGQSRLARGRVFQLPQQLHLLVGRDVHELEAIRQLIIRALGWGGVITLALGLAGGIALSWTALRRIEAINQTSREIMAGAIERRVPTRGTGDDFDQLAENLNAMLDRIGELMNGIRQVSDNIAHDLKTPLTRLRNQLERAQMDGPLVSAAYLPDAIVEADRLLSMFNSMLRIARVEAESLEPFRDTVAVDAVMADVIELYEPVAEEKEITLGSTLAPHAQVLGDRDLLFQCFANLLDNAIKFTPHEGDVDVTVAVDEPTEKLGSMVRVMISDSGSGVPEEDRERIFRRFYRVETSRQAPGHGLGLSLVRAVIDRHRGRIALSNRHPGLCVELNIPARSVDKG
ncbi:MAG: HAMP domain-containing sensor histidine kinase [Pseudomonadota bacterium]